MKNLEELNRLREQVKERLAMRTGDYPVRVIICMGTCGIAAGARETMNAFLDLVSASGRSDIMVTASGCAGFCEQEPLVRVTVEGEPDEAVYGKVDARAAREIFTGHIVGGRVVEKYLFTRDDK